jgi:hypothetical protein
LVWNIRRTIKYDGVKFKTFSFKHGLPGVDAEIWGLMIDKNGLIWVGATGGVCQFSGEKFMPFTLPVSKSKMHNQCYLTNWVL